MSKVCSKGKCYVTKKNKCRAPNPWVMFLRTGDAASSYQKIFKPKMRALAKELGPKHTKAQLNAKLCKYFEDHMKAVGMNTPATKKKVRSGVAKVLKADKQAAAALAEKEEALKKAAADLVAKKKVEKFVKKRAQGVIKKYIEAAAKARKLKKEADAAKAKAKANNAAPVRRSSRRTGSRARQSPTPSRASAAKKASDAKSAKRKAESLGQRVSVARKSLEIAEKAVVVAEKKKAVMKKQTVHRALAGLDGHLKAKPMQSQRRFTRRTGLRKR